LLSYVLNSSLIRKDLSYIEGVFSGEKVTKPFPRSKRKGFDSETLDA